MSIFRLLAARSVSMRETPACEKRFLRSWRKRQILVQQLLVVAAGEPARAPGLVEAEPESVGVDFLTHAVSSMPSRAAALPDVFFARAGLAAALFPSTALPSAPVATIFSGRSDTFTVRWAVRFTTR